MHPSDDELLEVDGVVEEIDGVPVLVAGPGREVHHRSITPALVARAAAVAATGFAAGAATAALVSATRSRKAVRTRRPPARLDGLQVVATRSFLVDVHILAPRD